IPCGGINSIFARSLLRNLRSDPRPVDPSPGRDAGFARGRSVLPGPAAVIFVQGIATQSTCARNPLLRRGPLRAQSLGNQDASYREAGLRALPWNKAWVVPVYSPELFVHRGESHVDQDEECRHRRDDLRVELRRSGPRRANQQCASGSTSRDLPLSPALASTERPPSA